ncbi:MAG: hypothetical protein MZV70_75770 [Desulfobacterales bacterium]|nr:hypothetical protein [Desulfobacterales bacterium]
MLVSTRSTQSTPLEHPALGAPALGDQQMEGPGAFRCRGRADSRIRGRAPCAAPIPAGRRAVSQITTTMHVLVPRPTATSLPPAVDR